VAAAVDTLPAEPTLAAVDASGIKANSTGEVDKNEPALDGAAEAADVEEDGADHEGPVPTHADSATVAGSTAVSEVLSNLSALPSADLVDAQQLHSPTPVATAALPDSVITEDTGATVASAAAIVAEPQEELLPLPELPRNKSDYHAAYAQVLAPVLEIVAERVNPTVRTTFNADMTPRDFSHKTQEQLRATSHYALGKLDELQAGNARAANLQQQALGKKMAALNAKDQKAQQQLLREARDLEQEAQALKTSKNLATLRENLLTVMDTVYAEQAQEDPMLSQSEAKKHTKEDAAVKRLPKAVAAAVMKNVNDEFASDDVEEVLQSRVDAIIGGNLPLGTINAGYGSEEVTFLGRLQHLSDNADTANPHTVAALVAHRGKLAAVRGELGSRAPHMESSFETEALPHLPSLEGVTTLAHAVEILSGRNDQGTVTNELMATLPTQRGALNARVQEVTDSLSEKRAKLNTLKGEKIHNTDMILKLGREIVQLSPQLAILEEQLHGLDALITARDAAVAKLTEHFAPKQVKAPKAATSERTASVGSWFSFSGSSLVTAPATAATSEPASLTIQQVFADVVEETAHKALSEQERLHQLRLASYTKNTEAQAACYKDTPRTDLKRQVKAGYPATTGRGGFTLSSVDLSGVKPRPAQDTLQAPTLLGAMAQLMASPDLKAWKKSHTAVMAKMRTADADEHHDDDDATPAAPATGDALSALAAATAEV